MSSEFDDPQTSTAGPQASAPGQHPHFHSAGNAAGGPPPTSVPFGASFFASLRASHWRRPQQRWVGGVCSAIAANSGWDVALVRGVTLVGLFIFGAPVAVAYALGWALIPEQLDGRIHCESLFLGRPDVAHLGQALLLMSLFTPNSGLVFTFGDFDFATFGFSVVGVALLATVLVLFLTRSTKQPPHPPGGNGDWNQHYSAPQAAPFASPAPAQGPIPETPYIPTPEPREGTCASEERLATASSASPATDPQVPTAADVAGTTRPAEAFSAPVIALPTPPTTTNSSIASPAPAIWTDPTSAATSQPYQGGNPYQGLAPTPCQSTAWSSSPQVYPANSFAPVTYRTDPGPGLPTFLAITGTLLVVAALSFAFFYGNTYAFSSFYHRWGNSYATIDSQFLGVYMATVITVGTGFILGGATLIYRALRGKPGTWLTVLSAVLAFLWVPLFAMLASF